MLLPVLERFAELGWQPFVEPAETYEFFLVAGIFKRAHVESKADAVKKTDSGAQLLIQRNALFDVCLHSGLAHLIAAYMRAEDKFTSKTKMSENAKNYLLKEPIAVQQWLRRTLEAMERTLNAQLLQDKVNHTTGEELRKLSGLRTIAIALIERLKEGSRHASKRTTAWATNVEEATELHRLTNAGMRNLLELLYRIQSITLATQTLLWLEENQIQCDRGAYEAFYKRTREVRANFQLNFQRHWKHSHPVKEQEPNLLIEGVMKSANLTTDQLPPTSMQQLVGLLQSSTIQDEIFAYYSDELDQEPLETYFRVHVAIAMYFCLDLAYLSQLSRQKHDGALIARKMVAFAESFAAQLGVREDMKLTLLALWLIENGASVYTTDDAVGPSALYDSAVRLLQQSNAIHLHEKYALEDELLLAIVQTLVHRGESNVAWAIWNAFGVDMSRQSTLAVELAVAIALDLQLWQRALSLVRAHGRNDLLEQILMWLATSNRLKEVVHGLTFEADEEPIFCRFMMGGSPQTIDQDVVSDEAIKRVDLLVMYYALRHQFDKAWNVHQQHLALIRTITSGDTQIVTDVLARPSFAVRKALLENLSPEPVMTSESSEFSAEDIANLLAQRREHEQASPANEPVESDQEADQPMDQADTEKETDDIEMEPIEQPTASAAAATTPSSANAATPLTSPAFEYSPGIFSSRASQPRSSSAKKRKPSLDPIPSSSRQATPTAASSGGASTPKRMTPGATPIGAIDTSPDASARGIARRQSIETIALTLDFGASPTAAPKGSGSGVPPKPVASSDRRLSLSTTPMRARFNSSLATSSPSTSQRRSMDDLALKPQTSPSMGANTGLEIIGAAMRGNLTSSKNQAADEPMDDGFSTPRKFQFFSEPPESRIPATTSKVPLTMMRMEEPVGEEQQEEKEEDQGFSTPLRATGASGRRREPASVPVRRNPRRSARTKY